MTEALKKVGRAVPCAPGAWKNGMEPKGGAEGLRALPVSLEGTEWMG